MSHVTILDASVLIAAMNPADAHHRQALALIRREAITGTLIAHGLTIAESAVGAASSGRLSQLREAYDSIGIRVVPTDDDEPWRLARLRATTRLPMPDCCVLHAAQSTGGHLATFDQRLATAARDHEVPLAMA